MAATRENCSDACALPGWFDRLRVERETEDAGGGPRREGRVSDLHLRVSNKQPKLVAIDEQPSSPAYRNYPTSLT